MAETEPKNLYLEAIAQFKAIPPEPYLPALYQAALVAVQMAGVRQRIDSQALFRTMADLSNVAIDRAEQSGEPNVAAVEMFGAMRDGYRLAIQSESKTAPKASRPRTGVAGG